jgi:serine/threonine protein kinase
MSIAEEIYQRFEDLNSLEHDFLCPRLALPVNYDRRSLSIIYHPFGRPMDKTAWYALEMCRCVAVLRKLGIVHRDIRPTHFLNISLSSNKPYLMLIDFGFAYVIPSTQKQELVPFNGSSHFCPTHILREMTKRLFISTFPNFLMTWRV